MALEIVLHREDNGMNLLELGILGGDFVVFLDLYMRYWSDGLVHVIVDD